MSDQTQNPPSPTNGQPRLAASDPVAAEQLHRLRLLQESRLDIADRFLQLEQEKVKLLAAARRVDEEKQRVFEGILIERGLAPDATVEIDAASGSLKVVSGSSEPVVRPAPQSSPPQ